MVGITALPTPPSTSDPTTFATRADALLGALPTFVTEANAYGAYLASSATPGGWMAPFTFSSTTTDSDPGAGYLRLSNATQTSATAIRVDLTDGAGNDITSLLGLLDDSTSTVKGYIRITKVGDGSKWVIYEVTALASPSGYRNVTVQNGIGSASSPLTDGDLVILTFTPKGDKGDTGANGPWANIMTAATPSGSSVITFNSIPSGYADLKFDWKNVGLSGVGDNIRASVTTDGTNWSSYVTITTSSLTSYDGDITIIDYLGPRPRISVTIGTGPSTSPSISASSIANNQFVTSLTSGMVGIRFNCSGGATFNSGTIQPRAR